MQHTAGTQLKPDIKALSLSSVFKRYFQQHIVINGNGNSKKATPQN